jgi:hypothetical protein
MLPITQDSSCCMRRICQAAMLCFHRVLDAPLIAWSARTRVGQAVSSLESPKHLRPR